jgi:recombination protein RecA
MQVDLVAVDSVAALLPRAELEGVIGDQQVASQARLMSYGLRKLAANAHRTNTTIMFINQLRHRVSMVAFSGV